MPNPWFFCWFPLYIKYFKCLLWLSPMIFLPFPIWYITNSNFYFVPKPWFFCWFPLYIKYFKCLLRLNTMIFLSFPKWFHTYSNLYLVPNPWFFFLLPLYFIFLLFFFTLVQTHDFFAHFFYIMNFKSLPWPNPMIFFLFPYNSRQIKAFTLCQAHDFFILFLCKSVQIHDFSSISTDKSTNHITFWQRTIIFLLFL